MNCIILVALWTSKQVVPSSNPAECKIMVFDQYFFHYFYRKLSIMVSDQYQGKWVQIQTPLSAISWFLISILLFLSKIVYHGFWSVFFSLFLSKIAYHGFDQYQSKWVWVRTLLSAISWFLISIFSLFLSNCLSWFLISIFSLFLSKIV